MSDFTAFILAGGDRVGHLVEYSRLQVIFSNPKEQRTEVYLLEVGIAPGPWCWSGRPWPGPRYREFFAHRLIVPQLRQGRPIWFIGGAAEDRPTRQPKYLSLASQRPLLGLRWQEIWQ